MALRRDMQGTGYVVRVKLGIRDRTEEMETLSCSEKEYTVWNDVFGRFPKSREDAKLPLHWYPTRIVHYTLT
jgi:hypothetical protein